MRILRKKIMEMISILEAEDLDELEVRNLWTTVRVARRRRLRSAEIEHNASKIAVDIHKDTPAKIARSASGDIPFRANCAATPPPASSKYSASSRDTPTAVVLARFSVGKPAAEPKMVTRME